MILIKSSFIFFFLNSRKFAKDRKIYEFFLIDTNLVEITNNHDTNNSSRIAHSKIKILKVLIY